MTEKQKIFQDAIVAHLQSEGYRPEVDSDGDVKFKKEGLSYFLIFDEGDDEFLQLACPNFWKSETDEEKLKAIAACNAVNATVKVAKLSLQPHNNKMWATAEVFINSPEPFLENLERTLGAIGSGIRRFKDEMDTKPTSRETVL